MTQLVWFRRDLRAADNPALTAACQHSQQVTALFVRTARTWQRHHMGANQQYFLKHALLSLHKQLNTYGIRLHVLTADYFSDCSKLLAEFMREHHVTDLHCNREYPWDERRRDHRIYQLCQQLKIGWHCYDDQCLISPDLLKTGQGKVYTVFTPFKKAALKRLDQQRELSHIAATPAKIQTVGNNPPPPALMDWQIDSSAALNWLTASETAAQHCLQQFAAKRLHDYANQRDFPGVNGTSQLSPYLALGLISPRQCLAAICEICESEQITELTADPGAATWLSELLWRDFYRMICWHFPRVSRGCHFKPSMHKIVWSDNDAHFEAWCCGRTGLPIIDSAMRQLCQTGWMHNRLRMICAMFLSKNLWIDWRRGEAFFAQHLVDWDFASNNGGWQWSASTGTDAAPYFRIFNPITQSQRFDPQGDFIRHFCPELQAVDNRHIHAPHLYQPTINNYPKPLVDLKLTRQAAIDRMRSL